MTAENGCAYCVQDEHRICGVQNSGGYRCTRARHEKGDHVACGVFEHEMKIWTAKTAETKECDNRECSHDITQHVLGDDGKRGICMASDRLGYSICRCEAFEEPV